MLNQARIIGRYTLTGSIKLISPLLIRAGVYNDMSNDTIDDVVVRYHDGTPFIPGTSLAGVLRAILRNSDKFTGLESILFGDIKETDSNQSSLQINDISLQNAQVTVRDGISIDQDLGITEKGAKYDFEIIEAGATGIIRIECIVR